MSVVGSIIRGLRRRVHRWLVRFADKFGAAAKMTTSHKPTFHPAVGSAHVGGYRRIAPSTGFSVRDLAAHTKLKFRQTGQNAPEDVHQRDLKRELEDRERSQRDKAHQEKRRAGLITDDDTSSSAGGDTQPKSEMMDFQRELARFDDRDDIEESSGDEGADAEDSKRAGGGSAAEESDSDDDEAELMRELERIKKEREEDRLRKVYHRC